MGNVQRSLELEKDDLIVDIGSNDGNLLNNFKANHRVLGVTPEDIGKIAIERGIPTIQDYFTHQVASDICANYGQAKLVTATNVFAHIENINEILESVLEILAPDGMFISESHYLISLLETLNTIRFTMSIYDIILCIACNIC
jgi:2-polyprenyl-3-methyl-5-hydroxy-6-metoxy-1,4-benzoquinol methylase